MRIGRINDNVTPAIDEFVLKVASRCNIDCDYCYEYNQGDTSWKLQPKRISLDTVCTLASRIHEHAVRHGIERVSVGIHGGEPLLLGPELFEKVCCALFTGIKGMGTGLDISVQTNGMLITRDFVEVFKKFDVKVGVSLDGNRWHNDRHRLTKGGATTFARVIGGVSILRENAPHLFSGILAVVDLENDGVSVVNALYETGARNIDLLLPHHNWDKPPDKNSDSKTPYADWYMRIWAPWVRGDWPGLRIRFLENIVMRLTGHPGIYEQMSVSPATLVAISTSGGIEGVDTLKSTGNSSHLTTFNIRDHPFDDVLEQRFYKERCFPMEALSEACKSCDIGDLCVGGYLPHRFSKENGFANPSVYCKDLYALVGRIERDLQKGNI